MPRVHRWHRGSSLGHSWSSASPSCPSATCWLGRGWKGIGSMIDTATTAETLSIPVGDLREASVHIRFGGGELVLRPAEGDVLVAGTFEGGVVLRSSSPGTIDLEPREPGRSLLSGCRLQWDLALTKDIP